MLVKTKGIIFRTVKYRESSLILEIYTRELGLRSYIINGVRKKKARTSAALLQVMNQVELVVYEQEMRDVNRIKEVQPSILYRELLFDIKKSSVGLFILEISRKSIREKEANPKLFDFLASTFSVLDRTRQSLSVFHIVFLIQFSAWLGFKPEKDQKGGGIIFDMREGVFLTSAPYHRDYFGAPESLLLKDLLDLSIEEGLNKKTDKKSRLQLLEYLLQYFRIHLGDFGKIKSLEIFRDIFKL